MDSSADHQADPADPAAAPPTRRHVLALGAVVGAGGALVAACGGGTSSAGSSSSGSASSTPSTSSSSGSPSASAGPLVATAQVPVGGGVVLDPQKIVVTQPAKGTFKAFTAICTHNACTVGGVKNNVISCPCHGSAYNAADGTVINGPATRPLKAIPITVQGGQVVES
jgi:Rieske Fe-S protein